MNAWKTPDLWAWAFTALIVFLFFVNLWINREEFTSKENGPHIDLNSKCPACGHLGCTLQYRGPVEVEVGEKRDIQTQPPCVIRKCNTCGALASEKTVLPPEKWIAK